MKDNLELLQDAREAMGIEKKEWGLFASYFIGALQSHVQQDEWVKCLETAKDCLRCTRHISSV